MHFIRFIVGLAIFAMGMCYSSEDRVAGWNKMQGLWGKRSAPFENSIEPQDKRTAQNWNKLNSLWGKRSSSRNQDYDINDLLDLAKRSGDWQQLNGLWGR